MARGGVARSNMLQLLRKSSSAESSRSGVRKLIGTDAVGAKTSGGTVVDSSSSSSLSSSASSSCYWVPHPRTGIYFPVGHDWVMEDVPAEAATFTQTCWFRNVD